MEKFAAVAGVQGLGLYYLMQLDSKPSSKSLYVPALGAALFVAGLIALNLNPYWRFEAYSSGSIDHRAFLWSWLGHLIAGLGLLGFIGGTIVTAALLLSRVLRPKGLYWTIITLGAGLLLTWLLASGLSGYYLASFHWEDRAGITVLKIATADRDSSNPLWRTIVGWQIEPDLNGYLNLGRGTVESTDGTVMITVIKIVPIATTIALGSDGDVLSNTKRKPTPPASTSSPPN